MLYTPGSQPDNIAGSHYIVSALNAKAVDNAGVFTNGGGIIQWTQNSGQNQKWLFSQNADNSWNITSEQSWLALDVFLVAMLLMAHSLTNGHRPVQIINDGGLIFNQMVHIKYGAR